MPYFFYGTLCDPDVLRVVLGYRPNPRQLQPAILTGFRRKYALGERYPVIIRAPAGRIRGLLFHPARPEDGRRLASYEGPAYVARSLPVRRAGARPNRAPGRAWTYVAALGPAGGSLLPAAFADWHPARWQRESKRDFLHSLGTQGSVPCAQP